MPHNLSYKAEVKLGGYGTTKEPNEATLSFMGYGAIPHSGRVSDSNLSSRGAPPRRNRFVIENGSGVRSYCLPIAIKRISHSFYR